MFMLIADCVAFRLTKNTNRGRSDINKHTLNLDLQNNISSLFIAI